MCIYLCIFSHLLFIIVSLLLFSAKISCQSLKDSDAATTTTIDPNGSGSSPRMTCDFSSYPVVTKVEFESVVSGTGELWSPTIDKLRNPPAWAPSQYPKNFP